MLAIAGLCGCGRNAPVLTVHSEPSPAVGASLVPQATSLSDGRTLLSWQRPLEGGGYAFEMTIRDRNGWSDVRTIAAGTNLSMFSADLPAVATLPNGRLLAYWELIDPRDGDAYATTIQTATSDDEGRRWSRALTPYAEEYSGQHSFLSWFPSNNGIGLLWLDADERSKVRHASMHHGMNDGNHDMGSIGLRYAALDSKGEVVQESFVDPITCECCPTSAAVTHRGPVVAYRNRDEAPGTKPAQVESARPTVRDIYVARLENGKWTTPRRVHADNWVIDACPDNGPSVDAIGNDVVVAWWTRSNDQPKVEVAFSADSGDTFGQPIRVDTERGEGQVTVVLLPAGNSAIVGWLEGGSTWARYVISGGGMSPPAALGPSPLHSRLPRWILQGDHDVAAVWTSKREEHPGVEVSRITF